MPYFARVAGLVWMTVLYWVLAFPITVPLSTLIAIGLWKRASFDSRAAGIMLMQLWFSIVATWVVAAAVSPGSGLGAL